MLKGICENSAVITVNQRLAIYLVRQHDDHMLSQGMQAWPTFSALSVINWIKKYYQRIDKQKYILNDNQALLIWQQIIEQSDDTPALINVVATAKVAYQAWQLSQTYALDINYEQHTIDHALFCSWANAFQHYCEQHACIDSASLWPLVCAAIEQDKIELPSTIFFVGFDEISYQINKLINSLSKKTKVNILDIAQLDSTVSCMPCSDKTNEIKQIALWAKQLHDQEPTAKIGCIIHNINQLRNKVEHIFKSVFKPESLLPGDTTEHWSFNISAAYPLKHFPVIHSALLALKLTSSSLNISEWGEFLRSPFIGAGEEMLERAEFDAELRERNEQKISLNYATRILLKLESCETLLKIFQGLEAAPTKQTLAEWAQYFATFLNTLGWPGTRTLNSSEYQAAQRWQSVLAEFAQLTYAHPPCSATRALTLLNSLAQQTQFQLQTPITHIQILGALEAAGMEFDHLWIAGMDNETWPAQPQPNPFLPIGLQRELHMPHASAEREFEFAQAVTQRLLKSAHHITVSYAKQEGDKQLSLSPLFKTNKMLSQNNTSKTLHQTIFDAKQTEIYSDHYAPAITADETIYGGTAILKSQAACPFQAFATFRLSAQTLNEPHIGLDAAERGSLLHDALANVWQDIKTQRHLIEKTEDELLNTIENAVKKALDAVQKYRPSTINQTFYILELKRLSSIIFSWLQLEKDRPPFKVKHIEYRHRTDFANIPLTMRIDRIDELENGSYMLLDYKTGRTTATGWFGERPDEPQLPLYCLTQTMPINAISFAELRPDSLQFKGISETEQGIPGIKTLADVRDEDVPESWQQLLEHWRENLTELADGFHQGHAATDPKYTSTCQYCDLQSLCRINEIES